MQNCNINISANIKSNAHLKDNKKWHYIRLLKRKLNCVCIFYKAYKDIYLWPKD